jgi:hypothetical protein
MSTQLLPLAITMMAGPQIMSAIVLVTGKDPVKPSLAFVVAVAIAATSGILIFFGLASLLGDKLSLNDSSGPSTASKVIELVLVGLLILASIKTYLGRETSEPPKWMGTLQDASPGKAFKLGLMLILLMPSDLVIMLTTGLHLQSHELSASAAWGLIALTVLIAALPILGYLLFRKRAMVAMPKVRSWMSTNSWLVNIIVFGIFIVLILG